MGEDTVRSLQDLERIAASASGNSQLDARRQDRVNTDAYSGLDTTAESEAKAAYGGQDGDFHIRIGRDGTWYYQGSPIHRLALVKLFATVLRREDDGSYWLVTPVERGTIVVEDAPFVAVEVDRETAASGAPEDARVIFRTNLDDIVAAGPDHPIRVAIAPDTGEPSPYVLVRHGLEALISRSMYYRLVEMAEERVGVTGETELGVWSERHFFPLGPPLETARDGTVTG
ncbi:MAG: DUF1285 domain-containing protein [Alphaproteobacteria bacterium]|nr:DUF1285 domain-containing protein [Alphaproteobacteria bacterium]